MNTVQIKNSIDENNRIIRELMQSNAFTLNNCVAALLEENKQLQKQCPHEYENGYCIYCYKGEEQ